jgi:hypothetical protein
MTFNDVLQKIQIAAQVAVSAEQSLTLWGTDHIAATQGILQTAGAGVAAMTNDAQIQAEAQAAAVAASSLVPLVFQLFSLFHHKKAATS